MRHLSTPTPAEAGDWAREQLGDLAFGPWREPTLRGGQSAADAALAAFDASGYVGGRNEVWPLDRRRASRLSPYIRHGFLPLSRVWEAVAEAPARDREKFRDELLWQEYSRHVYARLGTATRRSLRFAVPEQEEPARGAVEGEEACLAEAWAELRETGWITNQQRMWLASHWSVREGRRWQEGEELLFRHLLDGSRAANRTGWQWTVGAVTGKQYGFSRWQVEKRAPGLCTSCPLTSCCPIEEWPPERVLPGLAAVDPRLRHVDDVADVAGPQRAVDAPGGGLPDAVWITAESLGDADPALVAHPHLPAVFVFDEALLQRLRLSAQRLLFLAESLADLGRRRHVEIMRGDPIEAIGTRPVATTFAPVPGWRVRAAGMRIVRTYPWPWLARPDTGPVTSFTSWSRGNAGVRSLLTRR